MDPSTVGKEVGHPLILKIRVKTKVESSNFSSFCEFLSPGFLGVL